MHFYLLCSQKEKQYCIETYSDLCLPFFCDPCLSWLGLHLSPFCVGEVCHVLLSPRLKVARHCSVHDVQGTTKLLWTQHTERFANVRVYHACVCSAPLQKSNLTRHWTEIWHAKLDQICNKFQVKWMDKTTMEIEYLKFTSFIHLLFKANYIFITYSFPCSIYLLNLSFINSLI